MNISTCWIAALLALATAPAYAQSFDATGLQGIALDNPTSLEFGPDGRLYVSQQDGKLYAYTIRQSGEAYSVTATEEILAIAQVLNHQDEDGSVFPGAVSRQITGILLAGTADTPILYVTSSDYRIGGGGGGSDLNLDTNSGIVHKLTKTATGWGRLDLVRGLPRSEENHASNGMQLSGDGQTLFLAQGGHTNAGAPSNNFAFTTEYALSGAVLTIDLAAVEALPTKTWAEDGSQYKYDLPTLDDPTRANTGPGGADVGDPFGGNDGLNQAKLVAGGPVQVYAPGFRNLYDLVLTEDGKLYGWDNGPNGGWGGHPADEGVGTATNRWVSGEPGSTGPGPNDPGVNNEDGLHYITGRGYYGGHPNPVRANPDGAGLFTQSGSGGGSAGAWRTISGGVDPLPADWPPVPATLANPIEGDYQQPGVSDASLFTVTSSTNGMCEYTSTANGGQLKGDLLAASFNGKLYRVRRNASGGITSAGDVTVLAENFGSTPLDVTARPDGVPFAGTVWAATYGADDITVFTPAGTAACDAADVSTADDDGDGYANADEYDNGTDPCSQSSSPPDHDGTLIGGYKVSDLNDPDDDDDGLPDTTDPFALDADNGLATALPLDLPLLNGDPGTGFFGVGFTGLMTNGNDYLDNLADETNSSTEIIAGGAVGLFTINGAGAGDAYLDADDLENGFQLGFPLTASSPVTTLETKLLGPLWSGTPQSFQQAGFYLGDGTQDSYLKLVAIGVASPVLQVQYQERDAEVSDEIYVLDGLAEASEIVLYLEVDAGNGTVQPAVDLGTGRTDVGPAVPLRGDLLAAVQDAQAPAVGIFTTSARPGLTMSATWDYVRIVQSADPVPQTPGSWTTVNGQESCADVGEAGSCAQGRHEASYVQVGRKFYLLGGREQASNVNVYDPASDTWTTGASPGFPVHHFQAVAFDGLVYALGIFADNDFPTEQPYGQVLIYDPARDRWFDGPSVPAARRRGAAGAVAFGGNLYLVGGLTNGHTSGWSTQLDEFDPVTGQWTALPDLPRARDHFHAAVAGGKLYVAGGRRSGQVSTFLPTVGAVDVYDFASGTWSTLPNDIPTQRAAAAAAVVNGELLVIGGERDAGAANAEVEALDLAAGTWRSLDPLNEGRHGTQAIVNNGAVYVASGSPVQGGGSIRTQEVYTTTADRPAVTGAPLRAASVAAPATANWASLATAEAQTRDVTIAHASGNQGAVIEEVSVSGEGFTVVGGAAAWRGRLLRPGQSQTIRVSYARSASQPTVGTLTVLTSASGTPLSVGLVTEPDGTDDGGGDDDEGDEGGSSRGPDLQLTASASVPNPEQWVSAAGRFTLANVGDQDVSGIVVSIGMPPEMVFTGEDPGTASQGQLDQYVAEWRVGSLAAGATATLDYNVFNKSAGAQEVTAWVSAQSRPDADSQPSDSPDGEDDSTCFEFNGAGACDGAATPLVGGTAPQPGGGTAAGFLAEAGSVTVSQADRSQWTRVTLANAYDVPVVVAHVATFNGLPPAHARVRAVTGGSFEVQLEEWDADDGSHVAERVNYVVVEAGAYDFGGGRVWHAGRQRVARAWEGVPDEPSGAFAALASVASDDDPTPCIVRQRRRGDQLELRLQEEEGSADDHSVETVHYLLVTDGAGELDAQSWESVFGADALTAVDRSYAYATAFGERPVLLADLQTYDGSDPAQARTKSTTAGGFTAFAEEETAGDSERGHTTERLGYLAIDAGVWGATTTARAQVTDFRAVARLRDVETYWGVDLEDDRARAYHVERARADGGWDVVGRAGPTDRVVSTFDADPHPGENRYRLRTEFADGSYVLSVVRTVHMNYGLSQIAVYPNPSDEFLEINVPRPPGFGVDVEVVNALGQVVTAFAFPDALTQTVSIDHAWPAGMYQVRVAVGGMRRVVAVQVP